MADVSARPHRCGTFAVRMADVDAPSCWAFSTILSRSGGNSVRSRKIRLSAIRSFFRLVGLA